MSSMENNQNLPEIRKPDTEMPRIMTCQLLDACNNEAIAFAYIVINQLNLELSSNDNGFFQIPIPANFNQTQIEALVMPTYYEYKTLQLAICYDQPLEIHMKTVFSLTHFPTINAKDEIQNKTNFRSWLKNKILPRPNFDFQIAHSWIIF
jgi:hypothetical protein